MDYDNLIKNVGDIGHSYQLFLFLLLSFGIANYEYATVIFMSLPTGFQCDWSSTFTTVNLSTYYLDTLNKSNKIDLSNQCQLTLHDVNRTVKCTKWVYENYNTMFSEFDLVCDRRYIRNMLIGCFWIGFSLSTVNGFLSDIFGRKRIIVMLSTIFVLAQFLSYFSINVWMFYVLQTIKGFSYTFSYCSFNLIIELSNIRSRHIVGLNFYLISYFFSGFVAWLAYFLPYWRHIQIFTAVFASPALLLMFIVPESPRWLLAKNKKHEAQEVLDWLCKKNGVALVDLTDIKMEQKIQTSAWAELKNKEVLYRILCNFVLWLSVPFLYYGVSLNLTFVSENRYLSYFLMGLVEVPTILFTIFFTKVLRYKRALYASCCICLISMILVDVFQHIYFAKLFIGLLGKFFVACQFNMACLFTGESFPTSVRTSGYCVMYLGRISTFMVPFVLDLKSFHIYIPTIIFVAVGIVQMLVLIPFPETSGKSLPQSSKDLEPMHWSQICGGTSEPKEHRCVKVIQFDNSKPDETDEIV